MKALPEVNHLIKLLVGYPDYQISLLSRYKKQLLCREIPFSKPCLKDLQKYFSDNIRQSSQKKFLFYVTGRGYEPFSSIARFLPSMYDLGVEVIIFRWPSSGGICGLNYPKKRAFQAGKILSQVLLALAQVDRKDTKWSLMTHSMGNLIHKSMLENTPPDIPSDLFENITLNAPDTDFANHHNWVNQIYYGKRIYITYNRNDAILKLSQLTKNSGKPRLGQIAGEENYSDNANYLDFTHSGIGLGHEYFTHLYFKKNSHIHTFYQQAFGSEPVELAKIAIQQGKIYQIKRD